MEYRMKFDINLEEENTVLWFFIIYYIIYNSV